MKTHCPSCGEDVDPEAQYCPNCGTALVEESAGQIAHRHMQYKFKQFTVGIKIFAVLIPLIAFWVLQDLVPYEIAAQNPMTLDLLWGSLSVLYLIGIARLYKKLKEQD